MPKTFTKFNASMQAEFPFLKPYDGSDSEVICTLCLGKFNVADGGRTRIKDHMRTQKHNKAKGLKQKTNDAESIKLQGQKLGFANLLAKREVSSTTVESRKVDRKSPEPNDFGTSIKSEIFPDEPNANPLNFSVKIEEDPITSEDELSFLNSSRSSETSEYESSITHVKAKYYLEQVIDFAREQGDRGDLRKLKRILKKWTRRESAFKRK